jgi:glycine/D-amino acid oxidase-like deaminating enzyme
MYSATMAERERLLAAFPSVARRTGYVRIAHDSEEQRDCRRHLEALRTGGFPAAWYDGPLGVGVLTADDGVIDPLARCRLEAAGVASRGAKLFEESPAVRLTSGSVDTEHGVVRCRLAIVAVDGALASVLPDLGDRVWPIRLQALASRPHPPGLIPHAVGTRWGWDYGQQLPDGTIVFGGCRDVDGEASRTADTSVTTEVQTALDRRFRDVFGVEAQVTHRWSGTGGYTADGLPVMEEVRPAVWAVGGYNGTGNLFGAACARDVARLALGRRR